MSDIITPEEISELLNRPAMKIELIDDKEYFKTANLQAVTSPSIFEPNSKKFHPLGLFSEEIFGSITSMERYTTEAVIDLHTTIIHPSIFASNIKSKALYTSIMAGKQYAIFDEETFSFKISNSSVAGASTGFQFFLSKLQQLAKSPPPPALRAGNLHKLLVKYSDRLTITKLICLPAGLRDLDLKSSRLSKDDINKIYMSIINLSSSLSSYALSDDIIFDGIRWQMQMKVSEIYTYIMNVIEGKGGYLQKHYGARKIAFSTRNVISVPINDTDTYDDPSNIKSDETMVPMLNLIKCFQPFFTNYVQKKLYGELFLHGSTENIPATNPKTLGIEYITLKSSEINRYTTVDGVNRIINQFKHVGFRESPISIRDMQGKEYYLLLTYYSDDAGGTTFVGKSTDDLKTMVEREGVHYDIKRVKPMLWVEALYLAGIQIAHGKHAFVTRYPVIEEGSIYPSKIHVITTNPSKSMHVIFDNWLRLDVPHYPIAGNPYYESLILHQSRLSGLGADFDGDTVSLTTCWTKESNEEVAANLNSISSVIGTDMKLKINASGGNGTDIVKLVIHNLSRQDLVA